MNSNSKVSYPSIACAALGDEALSLPPFAPPRARDETYSNGDYAARFDRGTCRLCDGSNETLFHLACECTSAPVLRWRANALASLRLLMSTLWEDALGVLVERAGIEAPHVAAAPAAATRSFLTGGALPTHERSFILYWMLCATPWPRFATLLPPHMPQFPVANAFGTLFDAIAVRHGLIRSASSARGRLRGCCGARSTSARSLLHFGTSERLSATHPLGGSPPPPPFSPLAFPAPRHR